MRAGRKKLVAVARTSSEVEPEVTWSRYPGIDNDVLWIPSREYTVEDAMNMKAKCEPVIKTARDFLAWWFPEER